MRHPGHESAIHYPRILSNTAQRVGEFCNKHKIGVVVACGVSGIPVASVASAIYDLHLIIVRKHSDCRHTSLNVQGPTDIDIREYVIVDDLIDTGDTIRHILSNMNEVSPKSECKAILLYSSASVSFPGIPSHLIL